MAIHKKSIVKFNYAKITSVVDSIKVLPNRDLKSQLAAKGIRMISPMHGINDDLYRPISALEKELDLVFGRGGNNSDDCCTVQLGYVQALLIEHAGEYFVGDNYFDTLSGNLRSAKREDLLQWFDSLTLQDKVLCLDLIGANSTVNAFFCEEDRLIAHEAWLNTHITGTSAEDYVDAYFSPSEEDFLSFKKLSLRSFQILKEKYDEYLKLTPDHVDGHVWSFFDVSYDMGEKKKVMTLLEEPSFRNGYIGGTTKWSRYHDLPDGPVLNSGRVTGIGHIDYKDCTNTFVVLDGNRCARSFYSFMYEDQKSILKSIDDLRKKHGKSLKPRGKSYPDLPF